MLSPGLPDANDIPNRARKSAFVESILCQGSAVCEESIAVDGIG